jgi:hypothetical protein
MAALQLQCAWYTVHLWTTWVGSTAVAPLPSSQLPDQLPGWLKASWPLLLALMSTLFHKGLPAGVPEDLGTHVPIIIRQVGMCFEGVE